MRKAPLSSLVLGTLWLLTAPARGQQAGEAPPLRVERLTPSLSIVHGAGGNMAVGCGDRACALVDAGAGPEAPALAALLPALAPPPLAYLVNTHWHFDHTGANRLLGSRGVVIVAQENVRRRMSTEQYVAAIHDSLAPSPPEALPTVTFENSVSLALGGETAHVFHVPNAHTDGDAIVWWERADALDVGDIFMPASYPFIDAASGGSVDGLIHALDFAVSHAGERTRIIPGHGRVSSRSDLASYRKMLAEIRSKVLAARLAGRTLSEVLRSAPAAGYHMAAGGVTASQFVEAVYRTVRLPGRTRGR